MDEEKEEEHVHLNTIWKVRIVVGLVMLILTFVGLIVTDLSKSGAWAYWRLMAPIFAILSLSINWIKRFKGIEVKVTLGQELMHWGSLVFVVYLNTLFVNIGIMDRLQTGLELLVILGLATFLAGIYSEISLVIVGALLWLLALAVGFLEIYLWPIMIPLIVVAGIGMFIAIRKKPKTTTLDDKDV